MFKAKDIIYSIGCPKPIYYGESCNLSCPTSCKNRRCHIETGKCFGCEDGYFGPTCNLRKYWRGHPKSDSEHYQFHHAIHIPILLQFLHNPFFIFLISVFLTPAVNKLSFKFLTQIYILFYYKNSILKENFITNDLTIQGS